MNSRSTTRLCRFRSVGSVRGRSGGTSNALTGRSRMPTRFAAAVFGGWMAVLGLAFSLAPAGQAPLRLVAGVSAILAVAAGVRRHRPSDRMPWLLLMLAIALSALGTAALSVSREIDRVPDLDLAAAMLIIGAYPALAGVLLVFARRRTGGARDRAGVLDALTLTTGVALLAWTFLLGPRLHDGSLHGAAWSALAYPL